MVIRQAKLSYMETKEAIENGADELDMVINLGWVKGCRV